MKNYLTVLSIILFLTASVLFGIGCNDMQEEKRKEEAKEEINNKFTSFDLGGVKNEGGFEAFRLYKITIDSTTYIVANKRYDGGITLLDKIK